MLDRADRIEAPLRSSLIENISLGWLRFALKDEQIKQRWETRMLREEINRKQEKEADWMASPEIRMKIAPTFLCWTKTLWGFWNVSFFSIFIVQHLGNEPLLFLFIFFTPYPEHCSHCCSLKLESTTFLSQQLPLGPKPRDGNAKNMFYWTVADK